MRKNSLLISGLTYLATPVVLGWPRGGRPVGMLATSIDVTKMRCGSIADRRLTTGGSVAGRDRERSRMWEGDSGGSRRDKPRRGR